MSERIVGFDELDALWRADALAFQAEADFDAFFASLTVDLDDLIDAFDFGNIELHEMVQ